MKENRRLSNFLISRRQGRWLFLIAGVCTSCYFILASIFVGAIYSEIGFAAQDFAVQPEFMQRLYSLAQKSIFSFTLAALILTVVVLLGATILSHRFFGPLVPMKRFVQSIRQGDYSVRLSIRDSDELHDLSAELNEMVTALETRHSPSR